MDPNNAFTDAALVLFLVGILTGLGQAIKQAVNLTPEVVPLVNIGLGVALALGWTFATKAPLAGADIAQAAMSGLVAGLTSSHLYDAVRAVAGVSTKAQMRAILAPGVAPVSSVAAITNAPAPLEAALSVSTAAPVRYCTQCGQAWGPLPMTPPVHPAPALPATAEPPAA